MFRRCFADVGNHPCGREDNCKDQQRQDFRQMHLSAADVADVGATLRRCAGAHTRAMVVMTKHLQHLRSAATDGYKCVGGLLL
jgi:hypothetical protein